MTLKIYDIKTKKPIEIIATFENGIEIVTENESYEGNMIHQHVYISNNDAMVLISYLKANIKNWMAA